jgi:CBS domain-containing protein
MTVGELMTEDVKTLPPDANVRRAAELMRDLDVGIVPVVDAMGNLAGVVTDRDIVVKAVAEGLGTDTRLDQVLTRSPETVTRDTTILQAVGIMRMRQVRRLPVVEYGRLIGMLSLADLAESAASEWDKAETLEDVSEPGDAPRSSAESVIP